MSSPDYTIKVITRISENELHTTFINIEGDDDPYVVTVVTHGILTPPAPPVGDTIYTIVNNGG